MESRKKRRSRLCFRSLHLRSMDFPNLMPRVPKLRKNQLSRLAEIGALSAISPHGYRYTGKNQAVSDRVIGRSSDDPITRRPDHPISNFHRRDALWNAAAAANSSGPLLENIPESDNRSPLTMMTDEERLVADFRGTGMTVGPHPMAYHRVRMEQMGVRRAIELSHLPNGRKVRIAGGVIARQRPGTAKGFVFLSLEGASGDANA